MASKRLQPEADLYLTVENEDWVAIYGTREDLENLGRALLDFARAAGPDEDCRVQDPISPVFRPGSLGYTFYRRKPGSRKTGHSQEQKNGTFTIFG
jgi:hypothetical protein